MKAEFRSRLANEKDRNDLGQLAPLETPFVVIVDPASHCNLKCRFCPTGHPDLIQATGRYQGAMSFETFAKLIDDLQAFPDPVKVLRLYKEGEPLMNKRFAEMIAYARQSDKVLRIDTTTNGVLLTPKISEKIIEAGIDQINISVNGLSNSQFMDLTRTKVNFDKYVENIKHLYSIRGNCTIYIKTMAENLSEDDRKRFFDTFGDIADRIFFEHLFPNWPDFDDEIIPRNGTVSEYGGEVREQSVCPNIFYSTTVNSDGAVSLCIQDWEHKLVVGNVQDESLKDIWLGQRINAHRLAHLAGCRKDDKTCAKCGAMAYALHDDIDKQAADIRDRLVAGKYYRLQPVV